MKLIEQVKYKVALIVSDCCQGASLIKLYDEPCWESRADRQWGHHMATYYKISNGLTLTYLSEHFLSEAFCTLHSFVPKVLKNLLENQKI